MPFITLSRLSNCYLLAVLAAFGGLASGCQSSRPSFSFQPIRLRATVPVSRAARARPIVAEVGAASVAAVPLASVMPTAEAVPTQPAHEAPAKPPVPAETQPPRTQPQLLAAAMAQTTAATAPAQNRALALFRRPLLHRAHAPARQGLGLTVLGLLGMVALVVALIGLAISGGGVGWIITAAIAAGVVLLAYLDPGGH